MPFIIKTGSVIAIILLCGCQTSVPQSAVSPSTQVTQLAALIAGSEYLRDSCNQQRIASDDALYQQALGLAHKRGWDVQQGEYKTLRTQAEERKRQLLNDPTTREVKCVSLNSALSSFLNG